MKRHLLLVVAAVGCAGTGVGNPQLDENEQALIESGSDAMDAGDTASALVAASTLALSDPALLVDGVAVATLVETRAPLYFEPAECLVTTRVDNEVTFDFQGCRTGAFGLSSLDGELVATYSVETPGSVDVTIATRPSAPLGVGLAEVTLEANASFSVSDSTRTVVWNGSYDAERPLRPTIHHDASYSAAYDTETRCLSLAGSATTRFSEGNGVELELGDYERCGPAGTCPSRGTLTLTELPDRERTLTLEFDGDDTAWLREREFNIPLACGE